MKLTNNQIKQLNLLLGYTLNKSVDDFSNLYDVIDCLYQNHIITDYIYSIIKEHLNNDNDKNNLSSIIEDELRASLVNFGK